MVRLPLKHSYQTFGIFLFTFVTAGCAGPKVPAYETKSQKFSWGKAHVWMSTLGTPRDATSGEGYLLIDMSYNENVLNRNCMITVTHVSMKDPDSGEILIERTPLFKDGSSMTRVIKEYKTGQFSLSDATFKFDRTSLPYDLNIKLSLDCSDEKTNHKFAKKIDFKMVQPVIWQQ